MGSPHSFGGFRPVLRTLVPTLLYTAATEMFISRFLSRGGMFWIRDGNPGPRIRVFLDHLGYTFFNFSVVMAIGVLVLIGIASRAVRAWPSPSLRWIGPGLIVFSIWSLARAFFPPLAPQGAYQLASLALALGILTAFYAGNGGAGARTFAVLLGSALVCGTYSGGVRGLEWLGGPSLPWLEPSRQAGELLALACGAVAPGLIPHRDADRPGPHAFPHAILAAIPAALFLLIYTRQEGTRLDSPRWSLGWSRDLPLPDGFDGLLYAGVMFLFLFALFRTLGDPRWRVRGFGLAFLFLAGAQYRIAYQHLLGLIGLVLITSGGLPGPSEAAASTSPEAPPPV